MADPFLEPPDPATAPPPPEPGPLVLHGFQVVAAVRASNAGGTYEGREVATGRRVFMKEARAHNGLHWDGSTAQERLRHEHDVLVALHAAVPGVAPEPLAHFREWEHEFLVTEFVEGTPLNRWMSLNAPVIQADRGAAPFAAYYTDCARVLEDLDRALMRLHGVGYRFGDVNPTNVLVTPQGGARLVDFEAATHRDDAPVLMGANGYVPPDDLRATRPFSWDEYGANAIALAMLLPVHAHLGGSVRNLRLLYRDLEERAPLPAWLARRAGRSCSGAAPEGWLPTPEELDARPRETLVRCAEEVERALLAMAEPGDPARVFPTVPRGYRANTTCVAYGTAGVLHALHSTGASVPEEVVGAFRAEALARRSELPPGLHVGAAGVAWVLAEYGLLDEADELLQAADRHPIALASTTLGEGIAGLGMAHLALHRRTGDERWMTRAAAAGDAIRATPDLTPTLGANDARGLLHGRAGLALFLAQLTRATGEAGYLEAGRRLVHAELDRAIELPDGALSFADDAKTNRAMPYLYAGAAGMLTVATRYAAVTGDERIAAALPRIAADVTKSCTLLPGLYAGLAGLAFALAEHADWAGDDLHGRAALRVATGLAKYAAPHAGGLRFLGEGAMRYSAELWSGGAGVLLALHRVLHGHADQLFTLDSPLGLAIDGIAADDAGT